MTEHFTLATVIGRLESLGHTIQQSGGTYRTQCPAHGGEDCNLAFSVGKKGHVVFTCHSHQCSFEDIIASLDLNKNMPTPIQKTKTGKTIHPTLQAAIHASAFGLGHKDEQPSHVYRYPNTDGSENLVICRWDKNSGKEIRPVTKTKDGYIVGKQTETAYPIYRLPEIVKHIQTGKTTVRIVICEGEKATDAAVKVGYVATTSPFGSESAEKANWSLLDTMALRHKLKLELIILPDNDAPGAKYAESLVNLFSTFKSTPSVKVVNIADHAAITGIEHFPNKGDFADLCELLDGKDHTEIKHLVDRMIAETLPEAVIDDSLQWEPFPVDLLPDTMGKLCREAAKAKNIEAAYVATFAISAVASVLGSAYKVRLKKDWIEPAIIWTCLVTESGSGKSPGLDSALKPLLSLQNESDKRYKEYYKEYASEMEQYQLAYEDWKKDRRRHPALLPPAKPESPQHDTYLVDDATMEAVAEILEKNPFGVMLLRDELAGWFRSFDCYRAGGGGKDLAAWLSIHGGRPLRINRKTGKQFIHASNPAVSIGGGVQPEVLKRIVKDNEDFFDSGLTARILFAMPPDLPSHWSEEETSDETTYLYANLFRMLIQARACEEMPTPENPMIVNLSPEAKDLFVRFFNSNVDERVTLQSDLKAAWAKFTSYAARLALVFHVVQCLKGDGQLNEMSGDSMQRAIRLVFWFKRETARILQLLRHAKCEIDFESKAVLDLVERNGSMITVRELQHQRRKYRSKGGAQAAEAILDGLVQEGRLVSAAVKEDNKRVFTRYRLLK